MIELTADQLKQQILAATGQEDPEAIESVAEDTTPVQPDLQATPTEEVSDQPTDEAPAMVPGEPYQTKDGWQVDIIEPYPQVVQGRTLKEVIGKMAKMVEHGTKKIGELNKRIKPDPVEAVPDYKPVQLSDDESFLLAQEMQTNPTGAVSKLFKSTVGADPAEIREALVFMKKEQARQRGIAEAQQFLKAHPEYDPTPQNNDALEKYLADNNMALTKQNFEIAFNELTQAGTLDETEAAPVAQPKVQETRSVAPKKKATVGLMSRQVASTFDEDDEQNGPSVEDLWNLPSDELKRRIVAQSLRSGSGRR